jgi:hypothetical protein
MEPSPTFRDVRADHVGAGDHVRISNVWHRVQDVWMRNGLCVMVLDDGRTRHSCGPDVIMRILTK